MPKSFTAAAICLALAAAAAVAPAITITSVASGDWNQPTTWSPQQVPTVDDSVVISPSSTPHTITLQDASFAGSINIQRSGQLITNGQDLTVARVMRVGNYSGCNSKLVISGTSSALVQIGTLFTSGTNAVDSVIIASGSPTVRITTCNLNTAGSGSQVITVGGDESPTLEITTMNFGSGGTGGVFNITGSGSAGVTVGTLTMGVGISTNAITIDALGSPTVNITTLNQGGGGICTNTFTVSEGTPTVNIGTMSQAGNTASFTIEGSSAPTVNIGSLTQGGSYANSFVITGSSSPVVNIGDYSHAGATAANPGAMTVGGTGSPVVTISGTHAMVSNARFTLEAGEVRYTGTGDNLTLANTGSANGWYATGGTATFYGSARCLSTTITYYTNFVASGGAVVKFKGDQDAVVELNRLSSSSSSRYVWAFNDLRIEKEDGASVTFQSGTGNQTRSVTASAALTVSSGSLVLGGTFSSPYGFEFGHVNIASGAALSQFANDIYVQRDWANEGSFLHGGKKVSFTGDEVTGLVAAGSSPLFNMTVNRPDGSTTLTEGLVVEGTLAVTLGTLALDGNTLALGTGSTAGTVNVTGGLFSAVGTQGADGRSVVTSFDDTRRYSFTVSAAGKVAARYAKFEQMGANGIRISGTGAIDDVDNFSDCVFDDGTGGAPMLWIDRDLPADISLSRVAFGDATPNAKNIKKNAAVSEFGKVMVRGAQEALWGEAYELDPTGPNPSGLIDWTEVARPAISALDPDEGTRAQTLDVVITGSDFVDGDTDVDFGEGILVNSVTFTDPTSLTANITIPLETDAGERGVTVTTEGGTSNAATFTVKNPSPGLVSIDPTSKLVGSEGFDLTVTGTGFVPATTFGEGTVVRFAGADRATTWVSETELTAAILAEDLDEVGVFNITVYNEAPGGGASDPVPFTVEADVVRDVGATAIVAPASKVRLGIPLHPRITVRNFGEVAETFPVAVKIVGPNDEEWEAEETVTNLPAQQSVTVTFTAAWTPAEVGDYKVTAETKLPGDQDPENNVKGPITFSVAEQVWEEGWVEVKSLPVPPSNKPIKDGGWLAVGPDKTDEGEVIYAGKGNKTTDFFKYYPVDDSWVTLSKGLPSQFEGKNKLPSKGTRAIAGGSNLYLTHGNNTLGFWKYDIEQDTWIAKENVPLGNYKKKVKGGEDLVYVHGSGDTGYVYLLKGQRTEFYRFNTETEKWETLTEVLYGGGRQKYNKGSFLAHDDATGHIYAHQAAYNDGQNHYMFRYDVGLGTWEQRKGMPLYGLEGGKTRKKKSKDGAAGAFLDGRMYATKGGNTQGFFNYYPDQDTWTQEPDTMPVLGSTLKKKRVKNGGDLVMFDGAFFAFKGNKTHEFWRYVEPTAQMATRPGRDGVAAGVIGNGEWRMGIGPNPLSSGFATLRYSLPNAGPATVTVFDVAGRSVFSTRSPGHLTTGSLPLDLRKLSAGVYLVRLDADNFTQTQKLVVQK